MRKILFILISLCVFVSCASQKNEEKVGKEIKSHINGLDDYREFTIQGEKDKKLVLNLKTEEPANIRINQIVSPSGEADGPFGINLIYNLSETGEWKIIVAESLMNGCSYKGDFTLTMQVK